MRTLLLFLGGILLATTARAWDHTGHMLVAEIAGSRLSPAARAAVEADLAAFDRAHQYTYDLTTAACWMDDVRGVTGYYAPWHYIDIPLHAPVGPETLPSPNGWWLANQSLEALAGRPFGTPNHEGQPVDRPQALLYLLHIVGDLHQPLHGTDNGDRGGNSVALTNLSEGGAKQRNLHHFWDSAYRRNFDGGIVGEGYLAPYRSNVPWPVLHSLAEGWVKEQAAALVQKFSPAAGWEVKSPTDWVQEDFALGQKLVYGQLPGGADAKQVTLTAEYVQAAHDEASRRIVLAGFRLAALLERAYAPAPAVP